MRNGNFSARDILDGISGHETVSVTGQSVGLVKMARDRRNDALFPPPRIAALTGLVTNDRGETFFPRTYLVHGIRHTRLSFCRSVTIDLGPPPPQVVHHQHHHHHLPRSLLLQHLRPVSNMDSGLYSTSDSEQEDNASSKKEEKAAATGTAGSDDESGAAGGAPPTAAPSPRNLTSSPDGLPPRPPKSGSDQRQRQQQHSPSSSSGHHSTTSSSKLPKSSTGSPSPQQQQLLVNVSSASSTTATSSSSPASSGSPGTEMITKLRREVEALKSKFLESQRHWHEVKGLNFKKKIRTAFNQSNIFRSAISF